MFQLKYHFTSLCHFVVMQMQSINNIVFSARLLHVQGEEGALSMTTKERSAHASKGLPVNHCSGFRTPNRINSSETDGTKMNTCHSFY